MEDVWIQVLDGRTAVGFAIVVYRAVHLIYDIVFCLVEFVEVVNGQFCTARLVFFPSVQLHGSIEVGVSHHLIILLQVGLIDTLDGEAAHTHSVVINKIGEDAFPRLQFQLVGHQLGDENLVVARLVIKLRDAAFNHVLMDEGRIEIRSYTFEHDAQKIAVCLQDSLFHGKFLHMFYARYLFQYVDHRVVHNHRILVLLLQRHEVCHLYMASESYHLVAYGMLESEHNAYRHNHNGESDSNTCSGYMNSRARNFTFIALIAI